MSPCRRRGLILLAFVRSPRACEDDSATVGIDKGAEIQRASGLGGGACQKRIAGRAVRCFQATKLPEEPPARTLLFTERSVPAVTAIEPRDELNGAETVKLPATSMERSPLVSSEALEVHRTGRFPG